MKVLSISQINSYNTQSMFIGNSRYVENKGYSYETTTAAFRDDLNWTAFVNLLNQKYKDTSKVTIINHACSNGAEPLSLAAKLISLLKEKSEKFFPIIARDIDSKNIQSAKQHELRSYGFEILNLKKELGNEFKNYFDIEFADIKAPDFQETHNIIPKPFLAKKVKFKQSDILKDIENLPKSNVVLLCRNLWLHLDDKQREELAKKISTHFDQTCLFAIGKYDVEQSNVINLFKQYGLNKTRVKNIWRK